ncbi:MAG TPA: S41 family peptidase [Candidatus Saccharimonadales bacterium]|nr:S41 family peptidase [Candidatus Saccharimonadales bacterium]
MASDSDTKKARTGKPASWFSWKTAGIAVIAVAIFGLGVNVGNGQISWHSGSGQNNSLPNQLNYSSVNQVYQILKSQYNGKLTTNQLLDGLKSGLAQSTNDPYTEYFNASQAKQFNNELQGSFSGIGAQLGENSNNTLEIIAPLAGTPAAKAGLQPKDLITAINGKSTSGITADAAVNEIRGPTGSKVSLQILRGQQQLNITITRADITVPSVNSQILPGNIGYIQINQFSDDTSQLAQQAAKKFQGADVKGIILDLRDNPGGEVNAAVNVSSLWLPAGQMILQEKTNNVVVQTYTSTGNDLLKGIPTVVLINSGTASAAEITGGALHDNNAAYIIGTKSYGKGVVQQVNNLAGGAELKVTIASWYRPNGQNINHKGITPDKVVQLTPAQVTAGQDLQMTAAIQYLQSH